MRSRRILSPLIEYMESVLQRDARVSQVSQRRDDATRREIAARVVITADDRDAGMVSAGLHDQFVQHFEVAVIAG